MRVLVAAPEGIGRGPCQVLTRTGCIVDRAYDGAAAAAAACPYALILIDLALPGRDAAAEVRRIRRLPHPHGDPVILALTTPADAPDLDRLYADGLDGVLDPAGTDPELTGVLAHWLAATDDPNWGLDVPPHLALPLLNRRTLAQLEDDLGLSILPEVLETYFNESARRLLILEAEVAAAALAAAADQAHALKGSAGTFGALALRRAVHEMEQAGRAADGPRMAALLPGVRRLGNLTSTVLRDHYSACLASDSDA